MTEDEARAWLGLRVSRETMARLEDLAAIVIAEAERQNLIAASTVDTIWARHIVDSAQLLAFAPPHGRWVDLGSGAGFPGLVVGLLGDHHVVLTESRPRRATFLAEAIEQLGLAARIKVCSGRVETMAAEPFFDIISARAFAPLDRLFATAHHLAQPKTIWVLPKGRGAQAELATTRGSWQGEFRIVPSITDPDAAIIVADHVRASRSGRKVGSKR